jgi:hypothetical protein
VPSPIAPTSSPLPPSLLVSMLPPFRASVWMWSRATHRRWVALLRSPGRLRP